MQYIDLAKPNREAPKPGFSQPDKPEDNPGQSKILSWVLQLSSEVFSLYCWAFSFEFEKSQTT